MKKNEKNKQVEEKTNDSCTDRDCPTHGTLRAHGRVFQGNVTAIFSRRMTLVFERTIYVKKYERYAKTRTKIHARLPACMQHSIKKDDLVKVQECRPLSKIIHHVFTGVVKAV